MNKTFLIGNVTRDVEVKQTPSGKTVAHFSLAVKRPFSREETDFFDVVAWERLGETCSKFLKKGSKVAVSGYFTTRTYEKDGIKRKLYELHAEDVEFLTPTTQKEEQKSKPLDRFVVEDDDYDDCPF